MGGCAPGGWPASACLLEQQRSARARRRTRDRYRGGARASRTAASPAAQSSAFMPPPVVLAWRRERPRARRSTTLPRRTDLRMTRDVEVERSRHGDIAVSRGALGGPLISTMTPRGLKHLQRASSDIRGTPQLWSRSGGALRVRCIPRTIPLQLCSRAEVRWKRGVAEPNDHLDLGSGARCVRDVGEARDVSPWQQLR